MPFQMTHLHIAKRIHECYPDKIKNRAQFYLGAIAPDAVHNRKAYISDYKKKSHLCVGHERWGLHTNNDEWIESVLAFLKAHKDSEDYDFIQGYACHILSDIYNNIAVWTPFRLKYLDELGKGYGGLYHQESEKVEIELALGEDNPGEFWLHLEKAEPRSLEGIIYAREIEVHKDNILHHWYKDKKRQDLSSNTLVTLESTMNFIEEACKFISQKMMDY